VPSSGNARLDATAGQRRPKHPLRRSVLGQIIGHVTKRAARLQVLFSSGIAPLELVPIQAGDRFPVNFYLGFYRQPKEDKHLEWLVTRVIAYNSAGNKVAECQASAGPGHSC
jgi:hypothetical protein